MSDSREKTSKSDLWLPAILLAALILRLIYLFQYNGSPVWEQLTVDNWYHHHWAQSLADGNILGDTTYFRAPLYIYCLGLLYAVLGSSLWVGRLFGLCVGLASIAMTFVIGKRILGRTGGLIAAALHAVLPIAIYFESELLLDPLFTLLLQIAVWRFLIWIERERQIDLLWAGLAFGLASVCRPTALLVAAVAITWIIFKRRTQRRARNVTSRLEGAAVFVVGAAVCIGPIFLRNLIVAGDPVLIASQGGINLYIGNNEGADGLSAALPEPLGHNWQIRQITYLAESATGKALKPGGVSRYWQGRAIDWMLAHPGDCTRLYGRKLAYLLANREVPNERSIETHFASFVLLRDNPFVFGLVFPFALLGFVVLWKREPGVRFIAVAALVFIAGVALFFVSSRFRLPLMPWYCVMAAGGTIWLVSGVRRQPWLMATAAIPLIAAGALCFKPPVEYPQTWSVQSLTSQGLLLYSKHQWREADLIFRRAAEALPEFPEVNLNLGAAYLRLGLADSARLCFEKEIQLHPQRYKAYQNLASISLLQGEFGRAVELAETSLRLAPYDVLSHLVRLRALGRDSSVDDNRLARAVDEAAGATDDDLSVLNEGGSQLLDRGDAEIALSILRRTEMAQPPAIETDDDAFGPAFTHRRADFERLRGTSYCLLGYCFARVERLPEAVAYSEKAIVADSTLIAAYLNLRAGYLSEGRLAEADSVLAETKRLFPDDPLLRQVTETRH